MKKTVFLVSVLAALTFAGCKTAPQATQPVFPVGIEYRVLGRVTLEKPRLKNGYLELLKKAKEEMSRLGLETLDEYFEYLDFQERLQKRREKSKDMEM